MKRTSLLACVTGGALALISCGGAVEPDGSDNSAVSGGEVRVVDYYANEPDNTTYQDLFEACGSELGITVKRESNPGGEHISRVLQMGSSKTLPDLLMLDNPDLPQIAATGALVPLAEVGVEAEDQSPGVLAASTFEGKLYGLQPAANTIALFYNQDMLKEAGVEPPVTWGELKDVAAQLTEGERYGVGFSAVATYEGTWQFLPFMWSNGGEESELNTPEVAQAIQLWKDLVEAGSASQSVVNWDQGDVNEQFMAGNVAMMVNGPWQIPILNDVEGLNWAVAPIPAPQAGDDVIAPLGGETWTIPQTGNEVQQDLAAQMLKCINAEDIQAPLSVTRQTVPTREGATAEFLEKAPEMAAFSEMVSTARGRTDNLGEDWPKAATDIYEAIQLSLVRGMTPEAALIQATSE